MAPLSSGRILLRPRTTPPEQRQPLLRRPPDASSVHAAAHTSSAEAADSLSSSGVPLAQQLVQPPREPIHLDVHIPASARVWLTLALLTLCYGLLRWSLSLFLPAGLVEPPSFCMQSTQWTFHSASFRQLTSTPSPDPLFDGDVLRHARLAYGCLGNISAVLSARRSSPCTEVGSEKEAGRVESRTGQLTALFAAATMNDSYRVMNVALETYDGGYLLAARLWDGWLWEDPSLGRVRIAKYQHIEEHRSEITPSPPTPLPSHNVSSLLALIRVDFRFAPLSAVMLVAEEPEVQDPRLYWLHSTHGGNSSSRLFVVGNTGYPRFGSSVLTIKPRRVMMRGQVTAPASAETVSLPWAALLSEVEWSDQKNWSPLALHYSRHVFLVTFFPLQVVDCPEAGGCELLQCDRSTESLRQAYEVRDWRGGTPLVLIPSHYIDSNSSGYSSSSFSSSASLYLTVIHQRAPAPFTYHYFHRFVVLSIAHHGEQHVAVRYVSDSFQLPPPSTTEPVAGLLHYVEYITGLVLEQRVESPFHGLLVLTFGRRDSSVHYLTVKLSALLPFLVAANTSTSA